MLSEPDPGMRAFQTITVWNSISHTAVTAQTTEEFRAIILNRIRSSIKSNSNKQTRWSKFEYQALTN